VVKVMVKMAMLLKDIDFIIKDIILHLHFGQLLLIVILNMVDLIMKLLLITMDINMELLKLMQLLIYLFPID
jgi:hypothetical protein